MGDFGLISVIMPAYNAERTIIDAVSSVCAQTYEDLELLVIDDGSTDNTKTLVSQLSCDDERVRLISNRVNRGVSAARYRGVQSARGEWIAFLDSDDIWSPQKLAMQVALQEKTGAEILFTASAFINEEGRPLEYILRIPEIMSYQKLLKQNVMSNSSILVRKKLYLEHCVLEDAIHEDYACWLKILRGGRIAYGVDKPLLTYRVSANSKSGNKRRAAIMNWNTYRATGLGVLRSSYYMVWYVINGLLKYRHLQR